jgi:hypothetical protein
MTPEERHKIEDRAREALRESKKNLAALRFQLGEYANQLKLASEQLRAFVLSPLKPSALSALQSIMPPAIEQKLAEYEVEFLRMQQLQQQLQDFD